MSSSALAAGLRQLRRHLAAPQYRTDSDEQLLSAFISRRDDNAFAILVQRHGPMVLSVCRRLLGHEQDAEDAFQATFLVLASRADSLRKKGSLASFLHGIAYRLARGAKRSAARRRKHEGCLGALTQPRSPADPRDELSWREVRALLDEEIARLPEIYRSVFVLCCLEDISRIEAAQRLGLKDCTLQSRLATARKRLSQRLARRGVELTAVLATITLATGTASALPAGLKAATVKAASAAAAGKGLAGIVSSSVAELVHNATASMLLSKAKVAAVVLLLVAASGSLVGLYRQASEPLAATMEPPAATADDKPRAATPKHETAETVPIRGRVVDPDGKPVRGAKIVFTYGVTQKIPHKIWAVSADDGRFAFALPVKKLDNGDPENPRKDTFIVAAAEGYGFAAAQLDKPGTDLTLRLVKDDKPIRGRIIDLQGKPIAGVRVQIANNMLGISKKDGLTDWLAALKARENHWWLYKTWLYSPAFDLLFPPQTTGADGRFEMKGIGRERIVKLRIEGPAIATQEIEVMTRTSDKIQVPVQRDFPKGPMDTYYGADFELLAVPSRPIGGVVRDKDTGKPLAGVTIECVRIANNFVRRSGFIETTTDKDGRYRLEGLPKGDGNEIAARAVDYIIRPGNEKLKQLPYLSAVKIVANPLGLDPVTVDFALKRGVWVKGRVTDRSTGKPLRAGVQYFCFADNPNAKEIALGGSLHNENHAREDGLFQIPVLPGRGLIAVRAYQDHYILGVGADKIKGPHDPGRTDYFITAPYLCFPRNFHTLVEIAPKAREESITCDIVLDPGRSLKGTVLGPDGKPLAGTVIAGLKDMSYWEENAGSAFTVASLKPNNPRVLQFVHYGQKRSGYLMLRGDEFVPLRVQLKPYGALTGRILTPSGKPLTSVRVNCHAEIRQNGKRLHSAELNTWPDKDGRFRIEGLIAGVKYELSLSRSNLRQTIVGGNPQELTVKEGETKDVGDLRVKPAE